MALGSILHLEVNFWDRLFYFLGVFYLKKKISKSKITQYVKTVFVFSNHSFFFKVGYAVQYKQYMVLIKFRFVV